MSKWYIDGGRDVEIVASICLFIIRQPVFQLISDEAKWNQSFRASAILFSPLPTASNNFVSSFKHATDRILEQIVMVVTGWHWIVRWYKMIFQRECVVVEEIVKVRMICNLRPLSHRSYVDTWQPFSFQQQMPYPYTTVFCGCLPLYYYIGSVIVL